MHSQINYVLKIYFLLLLAIVVMGDSKFPEMKGVNLRIAASQVKKQIYYMITIIRIQTQFQFLF